MANAFVRPKQVLFYTWDFSDLLGNYTISSGSVAEATGDCSITGLTNTATSVSAKVDTSMLQSAVSLELFVQLLQVMQKRSRNNHNFGNGRIPINVYCKYRFFNEYRLMKFWNQRRVGLLLVLSRKSRVRNNSCKWLKVQTQNY